MDKIALIIQNLTTLFPIALIDNEQQDYRYVYSNNFNTERQIIPQTINYKMYLSLRRILPGGVKEISFRGKSQIKSLMSFDILLDADMLGSVIYVIYIINIIGLI